MMEREQALLQKLNHEIPLTRAMGIEVEQVTDTAVTLTAPLASNINHKSTAFGGSLYSLAVLAGWGLLDTQLTRHDLDARIVIQESHINYLFPVDDELRAQCILESKQDLEKLLRTFKRIGKARISLDVTITCNDKLAVHFTGRYVIHR